MQLVVTNTPVLVTRAVVAGMTEVVRATVAGVYSALRTSSCTTVHDIEATLDALHVRTDVELIGAMLSDMGEAHHATCTRVCLEHMHCALAALNLALTQLDAAVRRRSFLSALYASSVDTALLTRLRECKADLDHHFRRLIEVEGLVAAVGGRA